MTDENFELISMAPDLGALWGQLTKTLRSRGEFMLYNLLLNQAEPFFDREQIYLYARNETAYQMLQKYRARLDEIAGAGIIELQLPRRNPAQNPKTQILRKLFGEKLEVK